MSRPTKVTKPGSDRRSFLRTLAAAAVGFTILPPATTYSRVWRATAEPRLVVVGYWEPVPYARCFSPEYLAAMERLLKEQPRFVQYDFFFR